MPLGEPLATALLLLTAGVLLAASVLFSGATRRLGVPVALVFVGIGMLAGPQGIGRIQFDNYQAAYQIGTVALALILFDGGLNTPLSAVRLAYRPALVLATVGVLGTAALMGAAAYLAGFPWPQALLLGAVVSSTDAAAVFSILRSSRIQLKRRVGVTLELESGLNDPMAVILTSALTTFLATGKPLGWATAAEVVLQLAVGAGLGLALGYGARLLLARLHLPAGGLYPVLTVAVALLAFGVPTVFSGSGFLAVYLVGVIVGNGPLPYRGGVLRAHDAAAWFLQVSMFLVLGLLVVPSRLLEVGWAGLALGVFLLAARPAVVIPVLALFGYRWPEKLYIGWVGLRGAVPIILSIFPILAGAPGADRIFDVVFFVVLVNTVVQGLTVRRGARRLGLESARPPPPQGLLEISTTRAVDSEILVFYVDHASAVEGSAIADLPPFPAGSAVMLIFRGDELLPARGQTVLQTGDHVYVLTRREDRPFVHLLFGDAQEI